MQNTVMKTFMTCHKNAAMLLAAFYLVPVLVIAQTPPAAVKPAAAPSTPAPALTVVTTPPQVVLQHVSVGERPAILYDGLSTKSNKLFILSRFQPLEILVRLDKWTKVRDAEGSIGWVENSYLGERRFVQVAANVAEIRASALANSPMVFEAQRGVLLEITGAVNDGWIPVRHRDGQGGFVRSTQVWGS